jgi:hypothetical protein
VQRKWTETAYYWIFSKSKDHNSGKNGSIVPKTEPDLDILKINLYTKFHLNMCNQCEENERNCWWTDWQTDTPTESSKAICPPFFEGGHKNYIFKSNNSLKDHQTSNTKAQCPHLIQVLSYINFHACSVSSFREDLLTRVFHKMSSNSIKGQSSHFM